MKQYIYKFKVDTERFKFECIVGGDSDFVVAIINTEVYTSFMKNPIRAYTLFKMLAQKEELLIIHN